MLLKEIMTTNVEVVHPDATIQEAANRMKSLNVGSLPVSDGRLIQGIITDRDITTRAVADGRDPATTKVQDVMSADLYYCYEDQPVSEGAGVMQRQQIRRLPIVNQNKELVGIVALGDIAVDVDNQPLAGTTLETISQPAQPTRQ